MAVIARSEATKQSWRQATSDGLFHPEAMFGAGKAARADIGRIGLGGGGDQRSRLAIASYKAGLELAEEADDVVGDEDLAVAQRRGADADRRHRHGLGDGPRHRLDRPLDDQ